MKTQLSSWKNRSLVEERAYRLSARAYLVDGSWDPQIMETWGWMAALIRSKANISESSKIYTQGAYICKINLTFYFWDKLLFWANTPRLSPGAYRQLPIAYRLSNRLAIIADRRSPIA